VISINKTNIDKITLSGTNDPARVVTDHRLTPTTIMIFRLYRSL
jgi:hypothetical protein